MNTNQKIHAFLNRNRSKVVGENIYIPSPGEIRVQSTVKPDQKDFNDISNHVHKELMKKYVVSN